MSHRLILSFISQGATSIRERAAPPLSPMLLFALLSFPFPLGLFPFLNRDAPNTRQDGAQRAHDDRRQHAGRHNGGVLEVEPRQNARQRRRLHAHLNAMCGEQFGKSLMSSLQLNMAVAKRLNPSTGNMPQQLIQAGCPSSLSLPSCQQLPSWSTVATTWASLQSAGPAA